MDAVETPTMTPEARDAALAKLRALLGEPDPEMLALVEERDRVFEARLTAAP
ncbi:hypothetical protein [Streptosporangium sp. NPDC006007]|uniref:hypothetical protein n=1 Tax=Streptosporangium sp. NPDC006007 TaxID=3154575 RepID=UPI0033A446EE